MAEDNKQIQDLIKPMSPVNGRRIYRRFSGAPLDAVCDSQKRLAQSAFEFMQEIGFNEEGKTRMVILISRDR
jgi:hypothetical protein